MRGVRIILFALVWFSCVWFGSWERNDNQATRMYAAIGLVERGDPTIDRYAALTIDKAVFGDHVYLDKAPGMTVMAIPAIVVADAVTGARADDYLPGAVDFDRYLRLRTRLAVASGPAVLTAIAAVVLFDLGIVLTGSASAGLFAALGYALGTPVWGWSTTMFGHAVVADLYMIAIWAVWRGTRVAWGGAGYAALAGLSVGWAVVVEHQAVLAAIPIGLWALWRMRQRSDRGRLLAAGIAGGLIASLPFFAYNMIAFGTPFRIGYAGVVGWEGMHHGLFGLGMPRPIVVHAILIGTHYGLIWVAPVLALAPFGLWLWMRDTKTRGLALTATAAAVIVLLVNAAYVYWQGGNTTGPRFAIPAVAPLALGLVGARAYVRDVAIRIGMATLLGVSIAINAAIASAEIFAMPGPAFPVWGEVIAGPFSRGYLRTVPSEWFGWSPWTGFAWWAAFALPMLAWLAWRVRRA